MKLLSILDDDSIVTPNSSNALTTESNNSRFIINWSLLIFSVIFVVIGIVFLLPSEKKAVPKVEKKDDEQYFKKISRV